MSLLSFCKEWNLLWRQGLDWNQVAQDAAQWQTSWLDERLLASKEGLYFRTELEPLTMQNTNEDMTSKQRPIVELCNRKIGKIINVVLHSFYRYFA
jgi:hypothetical protein